MRSLALACAILTAACAPAPPPRPPAPPAPPRPEPRIAATATSPENMRVDKVGTVDGALAPDGAPDLAFAVEIQGPFDALFLVTVDDQGRPAGQFRANTLVGSEPAPEELGGTLDLGKLSVGIGVTEDGKFLNRPDGSLPAIEGAHKLVLYVPGNGKLKEGMKLRLLARTPGRALVMGPIFAY